MSQLTLSEINSVLPKKIKADQSLVDTVNNMADADFRENYRENLIGYADVLTKGKFQLPQYFDAVKYVTFRLLGDNKITAYKKTFPAKYAAFKAKGIADKDIASYSTAYSKNKLVNLVWEQSAIPFHVFNQDIRQKALMVQVELMNTAKSEKVRSDAANSVLTHLKPPEPSKIEMDIKMEDGGFIHDLRNAVSTLAAQQKNAIDSGMVSVKEVAHSSLVIDNETGQEV